MSHPQAPTRQPTPNETQQYARTMHAAALGTLVVAPVLALLPPRKLDFYTASLIGLSSFSVNYLHRERYGQSIWQRVTGSSSLPSMNEDNLPTDRAREFQRQFKLRQDAAANNGGTTDAVEKRGVLDKVWYGDEKKQGWSEKREKEIQEKMAEGKGYGDIIMDQIWDVWTWGKKEGDSEGKDQK